MRLLNAGILEQLVSGSVEPVLVAQVNFPEWPVVYCNPAMQSIAGEKPVTEQPLADILEQLIGRDLAMEISEAVRAALETTLAVDLGGHEYLLVLRPLKNTVTSDARYYAAYWRRATGAAHAVDGDIQQALLKAKRRIRDLSRDDPVTGLLNGRTFREVLAHDWAVAAREYTKLALVAFSLDEFDAYVEVFGKHAADSCKRRVAQAIRRCLRRASDVAARVETDAGDRLVVLSHSSEEKGVNDFATRIASAVRELGLHHPRSQASRFVTVSHRASVVTAGKDCKSAEAFLGKVLD